MVRALGKSLAAFILGSYLTGPGAADPLAREFALCAGRYSALVEHQWLVDGLASEATALTRDAFVQMIEAVSPPDLARKALHWRIEAKVAQAALLSRAWTAGDAVAAERSAQLLQACADLIGQS